MTQLPPKATGENSSLLQEKQLKKLPSASRRLRAKICGRANGASAPEAWVSGGAPTLPWINNRAAARVLYLGMNHCGVVPETNENEKS